MLGAVKAARCRACTILRSMLHSWRVPRTCLFLLALLAGGLASQVRLGCRSVHVQAAHTNPTVLSNAHRAAAPCRALLRTPCRCPTPPALQTARSSWVRFELSLEKRLHALAAAAGAPPLAGPSLPPAATLSVDSAYLPDPSHRRKASAGRAGPTDCGSRRQLAAHRQLGVPD